MPILDHIFMSGDGSRCVFALYLEERWLQVGYYSFCCKSSDDIPQVHRDGPSMDIFSRLQELCQRDVKGSCILPSDKRMKPHRFKWTLL